MELRAAGAADLQVILRLRQEGHHLADGPRLGQWREPYPTQQGMVDRIVSSIDAGETWMVDDEARPMATITINRTSDEGLWTPQELDNGLFAHRMILDRAATGRGIGAELLDFAGEQAQQTGRDWLRLDCWTTNHALHRYYRNQGFRDVRTVAGHSAARPPASSARRPRGRQRGSSLGRHPRPVTGPPIPSV